MERVQDIYYKADALLKAKDVLDIEREIYIKKQLKEKYKEEDGDVVEKLIKSEVEKSKKEAPLIDVTDFTKIKTLDEFINESIEKDRQEIIEIGESFKNLIKSAPEEDLVKLEKKEQSVEEFANESVQEQDDYEEDEFENILKSSVELDEEELNQESKEEKKEQEYIKPKYFVIEIGDGENSKQIVIDKEGQHVGKIKDGKFEINPEYINSKLEEYNIDDYISSRVRNNIEEQQRIRQELKPKTLEQLSEIDFDSGKDIIKQVDKIIEEPEKEVEPKEEEKGIKDEIDDKTLEEDEENKEDTVDKILKETEPKKVEEQLDEKCVRKLVILIPYTLTDQLDNSGLKERGEEITVYQFESGLDDINTPRFVLKQGDRILDGTKMGCNEQIQKNLERIPYSTGVIREVSDEKTSAKVTLIDGRKKEFLIKGEPHDLSQDDKNIVIKKLTELSAELNRIKSITPDDMSDYKIEFPGGPEQKCQRIDYIENQIYKTCIEAGINPPPEIKEKAQKETEKEELPENDGAKSLDDMIPGASSSKFGNLY